MKVILKYQELLKGVLERHPELAEVDQQVRSILNEVHDLTPDTIHYLEQYVERAQERLNT